MKRLLFTFIAILFFVSCSSESEDPEYPDKPNIEDDIFFGYTPNDTVGFNKNTINSFNIGLDIVGITALKNDEVWIGLFDRYSKEELQSWSGKKPVEDIEKLYPYDAHITENGYVFSVSINGVASEHNTTTRGLILLNKNQANIICHDFNEEPKKIQILSNGIWYKYYDRPSHTLEKTGTLISYDGHISKNSLVNTLHEYEYYHFTDSMLLAGFDDKNKIWFGLYTKTGDLLKEWTASTPTTRDVEVHLGYGEYEKFHLSTLYTSDLLETPWGYAANIYYKDTDKDQHFSLNEIFLLADNVINKISLSFPNSSTEIKNWYNESIICRIKENNHLYQYNIYNSDGEFIANYQNTPSTSADPFTSGAITPISYKSYIHISSWSWGSTKDLRLRRYNLDSNAGYPVWENVITSTSQDTQTEWTLMDRQDKIWEYSIILTSYSGAIETIHYKINIETGEIEYL